MCLFKLLSRVREYEEGARGMPVKEREFKFKQNCFTEKYGRAFRCNFQVVDIRSLTF